MQRGRAKIIYQSLLIVMVSLVGASWTISVRATHNPPPCATAPPVPATDCIVPAAPAVLVFVGGNGVFDGTVWPGGPTDYDANCEGTMRQVAGLLGPRGAPLVVPVGQRIVVGGNVVGFSGNGYGAYNLGRTTFATAW